MLGEILGSVVGGLLGGGGSESERTSNKIDERLAPYVYGKDGKGGLLADVNSLYRQQAAQGGLNPMMRAGLESQRQVLASPQYTQGYEAMRSLGLGLMGGGVAQNPFTSGGMGGGAAPSVVRPTTGTQYTPFTYAPNEALGGALNPVQSVAQYQAANPAPAEPTTSAIDDAIDAYMKANKLGKYAENVNSNYENFA